MDCKVTLREVAVVASRAIAANADEALAWPEFSKEGDQDLPC